MNNRKPRLLLWGAVALGLTVSCGALYVATRPSANPATEPAARDLLADSPSETPEYSRLKLLTWADLSATAEGFCSSPAHLENTLVATLASSNEPVRYLRGLLLLSRGDRMGALQEFQSVPIDQVPAPFLYAPYRLQSELHPMDPNPFRAPLARAAGEGRVGPLIAARVSAREANVPQALQSYLATDPRQWTEYDLELFPLLLQHAGYGPETRKMLRAALRGGRVKQELRGQMEALAKSQRNIDPAQSNAGLKNWMQRDAQNRELAGRVAIETLEVRRQFLQSRYAELLRKHADATPASQSDELVLLLTLSAAQETNTAALDRWSQELKRRYPQPDVEQWLGTLKIASK